MGVYLNFRCILKKIFKLCGSDELAVYTPFYKFESPNCHRVHGGLRVGNGEIIGALILFPDSDDKHLVWPVKLQFKLLTYRDGNTELLGTREMTWGSKDVEGFREDNSWANGIKVSLKQLKDKNMIGPDDSVTFIWAVKLYYSSPTVLSVPSQGAANDNTKRGFQVEETLVQRGAYAIPESHTEQNLEEKKELIEGQETPEGVFDLGYDFSSIVENIIKSRNPVDIMSHPFSKQFLDEILEKPPEEGYAAARPTSLLSLMPPQMQPIIQQLKKIYSFPPFQGAFSVKSSTVSNNSSDSTMKGSSQNEQSVQSSTAFTAVSHTEQSDGQDNNTESASSSATEPREDCLDVWLVTFQLLIPALFGDIEEVKALIDKEFDVNTKGVFGATALMMASFPGHIDIVKTLLQRKADVNIVCDIGFNALTFAVMGGQTEVVGLLIEKGADVDSILYLNATKMLPFKKAIEERLEVAKHVTLTDNLTFTNFFNAVIYGNEDIVKIFLKHKAKVNYTLSNGLTALHIACYKGDIDIATLLINHGAFIDCQSIYGDTPLILASHRGNLDVVKLLLKKKADVNVCSSDGKSALFSAVISGSLAVVEILISNNADVNTPFKGEITPLMFACIVGNTDIFQLLLSKEADTTVRTSDGRDALMFASAYGQSEIAQVLLHHEADVHSRDKNGMTALMIASITGHSDIIDMLLKNKADINECNKAGLSSLILACHSGQTEAVRCLLQKGAKKDPSSNYPSNALVRAAANGHAAVVDLLLEYGADVNRCDEKGLTSFLAAAINGHPEVIKVLLKKKTFILQNDKYKAILTAYKRGHIEVVKTILDGLADGFDLTGETCGLVEQNDYQDVTTDHSQVLHKDMYSLNMGFGNIEQLKMLFEIPKVLFQNIQLFAKEDSIDTSLAKNVQTLELD